MSQPIRTHVAALCVVSLLATGCRPIQPAFFGGDGDLSHYVAMATSIDTPDDHTESLGEVLYAQAPLTLANADFDNVWDISLAEAAKHTLMNSKIIRGLGGRVDVASDQLLRNPDFAQSIYGPALQETSTGVSGLVAGPEAALSAFDTDFTSSVFWQKNSRAINLAVDSPFGTIPRTTQLQDLGTFQAQFSKTAANGASFAFRNLTSYEWNNNLGKRFASDWRTEFEAEIRQPLLRSAGVTYNRIAGPFNPFTGVGTPGFDGVLLARIATDQSLADFESAVRTLLADLENAYWELYFAYRSLEARKVGMDSSLRLWTAAKADLETGREDKAAEALAREQYYAFRAAVESAKSDVFSIENRLRFIMGLAATDGRLLRPTDEPTTAKLAFDWHDILCEALSRNVDLRKQRWQIKQREFELIAAKNNLLPNLDAVGRYGWNGFGDDLIDPSSDGQGQFDNAFANLVDGDFQDWEMGLQFSMRLGRRQELAGVRNAQLFLVRDRAVLKEQELELSHLLADAIRQIDVQYQLIQTNFDRRTAAQAQVDTFEAIRELGLGRAAQQLNLLLDAQRRFAEAETAYFRAIVDYNRAIYQLHLLKGSLLEHNRVFLAEGPWPGKAYFDAIREARQRDASLFVDYGRTRPGAFSRGPVPQQTHPQAPVNEPLIIEPERIPTPLEQQPQEPDDPTPLDGPRLTERVRVEG